MQLVRINLLFQHSKFINKFLNEWNNLECWNKRFIIPYYQYLFFNIEIIKGMLLVFLFIKKTKSLSMEKEKFSMKLISNSQVFSLIYFCFSYFFFFFWKPTNNLKVPPLLLFFLHYLFWAFLLFFFFFLILPFFPCGVLHFSFMYCLKNFLQEGFILPDHFCFLLFL